MAYAPSSTYFDQDGTILGAFEEKEFGNTFEFSVNDDLGSEYPHKVWVTSFWLGVDHGYRYATVKKTVAYIVVDEDDEGNAVVEKWDIKKQRLYVADLVA